MNIHSWPALLTRGAQHLDVKIPTVAESNAAFSDSSDTLATLLASCSSRLASCSCTSCTCSPTASDGCKCNRELVIWRGLQLFSDLNRWKQSSKSLSQWHMGIEWHLLLAGVLPRFRCRPVTRMCTPHADLELLEEDTLASAGRGLLVLELCAHVPWHLLHEARPLHAQIGASCGRSRHANMPPLFHALHRDP